MNPFLYVLAFVCCISTLAFAQNDTADASQPARLVAMAHSDGDSVVLRWGVTNHAAWRAANAAGYRIERFRLASDGSRVPGSSTVLTTKPLKPLTIAQWKAQYAQTDTLAGVAVEALYGAPIVTSSSPLGSIVELETQQRTLHGMAHLVADMAPHIANGLALRFVDRNVKRGEDWFYEVSTNVDTTHLLMPQYVLRVAVGRSERIPNINHVDVVELEQSVRLEWDPFEGNTRWSGFYIEHSLDKGSTWQRVNSMPYVFVLDPAIARTTTRPRATYTIDSVPNYQERQYRIRGLTLFGMLSEGGTVVTAAGRDRTPPSAVSINRPTPVGDSAMRVTWSTVAADADLAGFYVGRSPGDEGPFESVSDLLPPNTREFVDVQPRRGGTYYYIVTAVDTAGNYANSIPFAGVFPDSIPPTTPTGLAARVDTNGIVMITWNPSPEEDLYGYRLFTANAADHEFTPFGPPFISDTFYVDTVTLRSLTEVVYYRLAAVDRNYNGSDFAEIMVKKPDILPPAAPGLVGVEVSERNVVVTYQPSPSADVVEHRLLRRKLGGDDWSETFRDTASGQQVRTWTDTVARAGEIMEYAAIAIDDAGLRSPMSDVYSGRRIPSTTVAGVNGVRAVFDADSNVVRVTWTGSSSAADGYAIYRSIGAAPLTMVAMVEGNGAQYTDRDVAGVRTLRYGVRRMSPDGAESGMAETAVVEIGR
mgnify:CR=1 FL=1